MGLLLFLLGCYNLTTYDYPLLLINNPAVIDSVALGEPQQKAVWKQIPRIRICQGTEVTAYRVTAAIRYWQASGYDFGGVTVDPLLSCMNPNFGEILITLPETGFSDSHIASTRIYTHPKTDEIVKAKIFILPKYAKKERVIEHEMGHALGWSHYRQKFHIMHPSWELGGYGRRGLRK